MRDARVVCVLGGGGAKAAAHVGAVRALREHGAEPAHYVGTSMGAVIAACFAAGLTVQDIRQRFARITRGDVAALSPTLLLGPFARSLLRRAPLKRTISRLIPHTRFDELERPLTVTAVDRVSGELVLFGAGGRTDVSLAAALYASCALPGYYVPERIGDREYIDGGVRSVLPLDVAGRFTPDVIFAVRTGPSFAAEPPKERSALPPLVRAYGNAMRILMAAQTDAEIARWREGALPFLLVEPTARQEATFALEDMDVFVSEGYRTASRVLEHWTARA